MGEIEMSALMQEGRLDLSSLEEGGKPVPVVALALLSDKISALDRNSRWWLGDLLNYAEAKHPDDWHQIVDSAGHDIDDVIAMQVTAKVHPPNRRLIPTDKPNSGLTWAKHKLFNDFIQDDAPRARKLMKRAANEGMTTQMIRTEIKAATAIEVEGEKVEAPGVAPTSVVTGTWNVSVAAQDGAMLDDLRGEIEGFIRTVLGDKGVVVTNISSKISGAVPEPSH